MAGILRAGRFWIAVGIVAALASVVAYWIYMSDDVVSLTSTSPDKMFHVELVEVQPHVPLRSARRFEIVLHDMRPEPEPEKRPKGKRIAKEQPDRQAVIFRGQEPDSRPGAERFIWSPSSEYLLLVGKNFHDTTGETVPGGEQAYFLFHLPTGLASCNSTKSPLPRFTRMDLITAGYDVVLPTPHGSHP